MQLLVATTNPGKQKEIRMLLANSGYDLVFPNELPSVATLEVDETGKTFEANALLKAKAFAEASGLLSVSEDSGLEVLALENFPGVRSARWMEGTGNQKAQGIIDKLGNNPDRRAQFRTVACLYDPKTQEAHYFSGIVKGTVSQEPRGDKGFDYDVLFIPEGYDKTFAELGTDVKNTMSGRALAFEQVGKFLQG